MNKKLITFIILYLIFGVIYQIYSCKVNIDPEDPFPCSGIVWTPIVLLGWPLFGIFDIIYGIIISSRIYEFMARGIITLMAFALTIVIPLKLFNKK